MSEKTLEKEVRESRRILIKFFFTNPKLIPSGIQLKERHEWALRKKRLEETKGQAMNKHRQGRVDTATRHVEFQDVDLRDFWETLKKERCVVDAHLFYQKKSNGYKKPVVNVTFASENKKNRRVKGKLIKEIEKNFVEHGEWGYVHYWRNPSKVDTLNCLHRRPKN